MALSMARTSIGSILVLLMGMSVMARGEALETGLHYYLIQQTDTGDVVRRGTTGSNGIAFDNILLAPNTRFRAWILQATSLKTGAVAFTTPGNGRRFDVPAIHLAPSTAPDSDGDGLHDDGEFILGTGVAEADSDGDGIEDGPEVVQGTDPLDGSPARVGVIGTAETPGTAVDLCALDDVVVVADSERGVSVFNVFNGMQP